MELKNSKTLVNLAKAFAGECQAGARYQFARELANKQGQHQIGYLMKHLAINEMAHAKQFFNLLTDNGKASYDNIEICSGYPFKSGTLAEVLKLSAENEQHEHERIYPSFAKTARLEGFEQIATKFELIAQIEQCHGMLLNELYKRLTEGTIYKSPTPIKWKCTECGHEHTDLQPWKICPVCLEPQGRVMITGLGN